VYLVLFAFYFLDVSLNSYLSEDKLRGTSVWMTRQVNLLTDDKLASVSQKPSERPNFAPNSGDNRAAGFPKLYVYQPPFRLNEELWHAWYHDELLEHPYGRLLNGSQFDGLIFENLGNEGQFHLSLFWYWKSKDYHAVTTNPDEADVFYLPFPFYEGLASCEFRPADPLDDTPADTKSCQETRLPELVTWLKADPVFQKYFYGGNKSHFWTYSRIWGDEYGTRSERLKGLKWTEDPFFDILLRSWTSVSLEATRKSPCILSVPYPTEIHFRSSDDVEKWKSSLLQSKDREWLLGLCFGRSSRGVYGWTRQFARSICSVHPERCRYKKTNAVGKNAGNGCAEIYRNSVFCFNDGRDSATRKGQFDAALYGCISVTTVELAFAAQWPAVGFVKDLDYLLLPANDEKYFWNTLEGITQERLEVMQASVLNKLARYQYANGNGLPLDQPDAFLSTLQYLAEPKCPRMNGTTMRYV